MEYAKEPPLAITEGDLPISREALLSSRQHKPLFAHTPGRRVSNGQQVQREQTGEPGLSETSGWSGAQETRSASEPKTMSSIKHANSTGSPEDWDNAIVVGSKTTGGSVLTDSTNYTRSTSDIAAWASKPQSATTGPASYSCGGEIVSHHDSLNLPEDPFAPTPCKIKSSQSCLPAPPTYSCLPTNPPTAMPPPLKAPLPMKESPPFNEAHAAMLPPPKAPPPSKRSLPFSAPPFSEPPANTSPPAYADSPMITTPHGIFLNPTFKAHAHPSIFSAGYQPYANFQKSTTVWPAPVHAPWSMLSRGQAQTINSNHHMYSQASVIAGHPSHVQLPYSGHMQSHAEAYVVHKPGLHPVTASHAHCDNTARRASSAAGSTSVTTPRWRSQENSRAYADPPNTDKPAKTVASTSLGGSKDHASMFQAQKLSSWCHVKHSRGETPELSRDQVKALVQAQIEAGKPMRTAWYRGSEHSSRPSIASTGKTASVTTKPSIISESNNSVSSEAPPSNQAGTGSAGQRISTGVFQPTTS